MPNSKQSVRACHSVRPAALGSCPCSLTIAFCCAVFLQPVLAFAPAIRPNRTRQRSSLHIKVIHFLMLLYVRICYLGSIYLKPELCSVPLGLNVKLQLPFFVFNVNFEWHLRALKSYEVDLNCWSTGR